MLAHLAYIFFLLPAPPILGSMSRVSSPSFIRQLSSSSSSNSTSSTSTSTSLCYNSDRSHNQNVNLMIQNLSKRCLGRRQFFQLHANFISSGLFRHPFPASQILKLSSDFAHIDHTILIFQQIHSPDNYCVNTVLKAYSSHPHLAPFYFRMLAKGFRPNSFTFPPLFSSCANSLCTQAGFICHAHSIKYGVQSVIPVQNSLIHMYSTFGLMKSAYQLFDAMSERDIVSWNSIIQGYIKLGDVSVAHCIFDKMLTRSAITWNIMISGYLNYARNPGRGLKLFREMIGSGMKGTDTTFVVALTACGRSARLKEGRSVHGSLVKNLVHLSSILGTSLIDMYSKCQKVEAARRVFDSMLVRNLVCWNAMILGHCIHGFPEDGITLFHDMIQRIDTDGSDSKEGCDQGNKYQSSTTAQPFFLPDEITFIGVLCACARGGMLVDGRNYFDQMSSLYSIQPRFAHYWCMANLYYGIGLIQEAEEVLRSMPEDVDGSSQSLVWSSLLGSCRFRGDIELGKQIARRLIELEPHNGSHYGLLFNIYAVSGQWKEAAEVKAVMKEKGVEKTCGCSLLDLNQMVHEFEVGDASRPGMDKVYIMLGELVWKLRLPTSRFTTILAHSEK